MYKLSKCSPCAALSTCCQAGRVTYALVIAALWLSCVCYLQAIQQIWEGSRRELQQQWTEAVAEEACCSVLASTFAVHTQV